jgi:glutamate-1-semialdehyde 2,1-aminomutase
VAGFDDAKQADTGKFAGYFRRMIEREIYLAPSQFESGFLSDAHSDEEIEATLRALYESLRELA